MEFFNYKPEEVKINDIVIGGSKVRFRDIVFSAHANQTPNLTVYPEKQTTYLDERQVSESLSTLSIPLELSDLGRSIDLYHPVLGMVVGTITIGEIIGIVYSLCIDTDKRNDEKVVPEVTPEVTP